MTRGLLSCTWQEHLCPQSPTTFPPLSMERENMWRGARREGAGGDGRVERRRRRGEEGMFNLLIQFLPMLVTLPLCKGGQMEHAAQNTQTKSHFLSTSQSPPPPHHLCVYLSLHLWLSLCLPCLPPSPRLCRIFLTFRHCLLAGWLTD